MTRRRRRLARIWGVRHIRALAHELACSRYRRVVLWTVVGVDVSGEAAMFA
jgi:hypothetical protein